MQKLLKNVSMHGPRLLALIPRKRNLSNILTYINSDTERNLWKHGHQHIDRFGVSTTSPIESLHAMGLLLNKTELPLLFIFFSEGKTQ
jgi:hypothetical protein